MSLASRLIPFLCSIGAIALTMRTHGQKPNSIGCEATCVRVGEYAYVLWVRNASSDSLHVPIRPVVQHGDDTLWVDSQYKFEHNSHVVYEYSLKGDSTIRVGRKLPVLQPDTTYRKSSGPIPFEPRKAKLSVLLPGDSRKYDLFQSSGGIWPTTMCLRISPASHSANNEHCTCVSIEVANLSPAPASLPGPTER